MNQTKNIVLSISLKGWQWFVLGVLVVLILGGLTGCYQGRKISRLTGQAAHVDLPKDLASYDKIICISFHKTDDGETIKDVTYLATDGKVHSQEYNDWGILQGSIIWELEGR
jgi:hypothetical protein